MRYRCLGESGFGVYEVEWSTGGPIFSACSGDADLMLVPGFVDIHFHGAFGIDFMSASSKDLLTLCGKLAEIGYEGFLPTTVTAPNEAILEAAGQLPENPMILGFHLEGPFISPKHPGAQPMNHILTIPTDGSWDEVLRHPKLRLITLAPELADAAYLIQKLSASNVVVSMGHSDATFEEAQLGKEAGARGVTHTYNAMRGIHHREVGLTGFALTCDEAHAELIYDRLHVSRPAADLLIRAKPSNKLVAVSDSTLATGLEPGHRITMWGHDCVTSPGEVRLASNGALAGSAITLLDAFRNLSEDFGPDVAIRACSLNPRTVLGLAYPPQTYLEFDQKLALVGIKKRAG